MVRVWNYGNYSSDNYGSSVGVTIGSLDLYFSYQTVVAFGGKTGFHIRENRWGPTTGKHLNWISDDKSIREEGSKFEKNLALELSMHQFISDEDLSKDEIADRIRNLFELWKGKT